MWTLLRAEATALANLLRTKDGRQALLGVVITLGCMALGGMVLAGKTVMANEIVAFYREHPIVPRTGLLALALLATVLVGVMLAMAMAGKEMFGSRIDLLLVAPVNRATIVAAAFVRILVAAIAVQVAFATPATIGFVTKLDMSPWLLLGMPLAGLVLIAPAIACGMLGLTLATRFSSGPLMKFVVQLAAATMALTLTIGFLSGIAIDAEEVPAMLSSMSSLEAATRPLGWAVDVLQGGNASSWLGCLGLLLLPVPILLLIGAMYRGCREQRFVAHRPVLHRLRAPSGSWPTTAWRSIAKKDLIELVRNRGGLVALLVVTCILLVAIGSTVDDKVTAESPLPEHVREAFALLSTWQVLAMLLAGLHTISLAGGEGPSLALLATAPITPGELLRGKFFSLWLPFGWTILVILIGAPFVADVSWQGLLVFVAGIVPITAIYVGVVAAAASHRSLFFRKNDVPIAESLAVVPPILIVMGLLMGLMLLLFEVRSEITSWFRGHGPFAGWDGVWVWCAALGWLWLAAAVVLPVGFAIARRHLRAVLSPQPG